MPRQIKLTTEMFNLLDSMGPTDCLLPDTWWAEFISLFSGKEITPSEASILLKLYGERKAELTAA